MPMEYYDSKQRFVLPAGRYTVIIFCFSILLFPLLSCAADISLSSKTYILFHQREITGSQTRDYAPLYEYLSADAGNLGGKPVSFHFYGWGRQDLRDETGNDKNAGELGSAYLQYDHPTGNGEARLGRFFLTEGSAMETMDGIFVKARSSIGLGASLYGGIPVETTITRTETGDSIFGGRLFFAKAGIMEIGVSYLQEKGEFQQKDRKEIGGDLWIRPIRQAELIGRIAYNDATQAISNQRYVARLMPFSGIDFSAGYEEYKYKDYFQTALNPAFLAPSVDNNDKVRILFVSADLEFMRNVILTLGGKNIRHELSDPGDANRYEAALRYSYNDRKDSAGISVAIVDADRDENGYDEYRAFATYSPAVKWRFSLDALTQRYDQAIGGIRRAYQVLGSAGYQVFSVLNLSGDLIYTKSPRFEEDYAGLIRVSLSFGTGTGGVK
jgi:hypothetical protein